ncbi:DUF559 domain-containing protein [Clostridium butyricum]|uniref:AbiJ-related protein n=1 Tax=Clostridium butyricum TaxID=1492 RepID=UPI0013D16C0F|nr:DUF559 domain-containing protein [Clostridium butyricum]NFB73488.1 DUF559 domain-containing protein [Clostridium butyricum]NFB90996.1 DUF559 domain-containing protein [Clostridium butyricum]
MLHVSDKEFIYFLEQIMHPLIRTKEEQIKYESLINDCLQLDGYKIMKDDVISGKNIYKVKCIKQSGVKGVFKNLIFASDGPKPEIGFKDSINNEIEILKNEEHCLVYTNKIGRDGLRWGELVEWWRMVNSLEDVQEIESEKSLYKRLEDSLSDGPEKEFFFLYYKYYKNLLQKQLPVLIPQVYLHYDPLTIKQLNGQKRLIHQRIDFLILFSDKDRVVIEIDGKQHYSENDKSSPKKYSQMVKADRSLTLSGYKLFRFGGYEFKQNNINMVLKKFFDDLFKLYGISI